MAEHSKIEWTDATWNPITGCTLVSEGCRHCYAAQLAATRLKNHPSRQGLARINAAGEAKFTGEVRFNAEALDQPLRWRRPRMIFVCAHGDLFHESVPDEWIDRVFAVMALCPQHTFQVLTKRPERMRGYIQSVYGRLADTIIRMRRDRGDANMGIVPLAHITPGRAWWPLPNVWLGTSVEDQASANARIPALLATPAAIRFISAEPLLGPLDLTSIESGEDQIDAVGGDTWEDLKEIWRDSSDEWRDEFADWYGVDFDRATGPSHPALDWVIVGGESGRHARPMHPDWARALRDQCAAAGVAFFFKQWGEWLPFGQSGFHHWSAANIRNNGAYGKPWLGYAHFNDGARGPETHSAGAVLTAMIDNTGLQAVRLGKSRAGRLLDGIEHSAMPVRA
ncbi:MAG: phage Gp37/Gp68 family protein [Devosia sp.]